MKLVLGMALAMEITVGVVIARANTNVVRVDVGAILNARAVATLTREKIVPLTADVDGAGGLVTKAVAEKLGDPTPHPLPDDGKFPATDQHPEVRLHFSNADGKHNQIRRSEGEDEFFFIVPKQHYSEMFLFLSSGHFGPARLEIQMTYGDATTETRKMEVPDWYFPLKTGDLDRCHLATNLGKWNTQNKMIEKDHHFIYGLELHPDAGRILTEIQIHKFGSNVLAFWGATGIAAPAHH